MTTRPVPMRLATTRRQFVAGAAASFTILPAARLVRGSEANESLRLAVFGTMYNATHMLLAPHLYNAPIVAICDPDQRKIAKIHERWKETATRLEMAARPDERQWAQRYRRMAEGQGVRVFSDIRRLLDEMEDSIDALVVSHYDHLHGVACGRALRAGKPVLSERPLGRSISDARRLRELASETKLPTTYRSPGTTSGSFRRALELVDEGAIGEVREVHVWFRRGGPDRQAPPTNSQPVPAPLDWNAWLGPLPRRDYHPDWMAYAHWRETCSGGLGTFGPHTSIFPFLALGLRRLWPAASAALENATPSASRIRVTAECSRLNRVSFPRWERVRWEVPPRGKMPAVTMTWHHGPEYAPGTRALIHEKLRAWGVERPEEADALMKNAGSLIVGSEGALVGNDHSVQVTALPTSKFVDVETRRPLRTAGSSNLYHEWIDACRGKETSILASFDNGGPLSELLMLGNIATLYPEETLDYDTARGRITNRDDANEHLRPAARDDWRIDFP